MNSDIRLTPLKGCQGLGHASATGAASGTVPPASIFHHGREEAAPSEGAIVLGALFGATGDNGAAVALEPVGRQGLEP